MAAMPSQVFRFAPSPNGYLHLGHALSALLNFEMARAAGGRFLLRIEDIDQTRCRPHYEAAIYEDLSWLGVQWEEPVRRQSAHFADYSAALASRKRLCLRSHPKLVVGAEQLGHGPNQKSSTNPVLGTAKRGA
jgi:glutamyl-Q tRNA(Asp) synthetase